MRVKINCFHSRHVKPEVIVNLGDRERIERREDGTSRLIAIISASRKPFPLQSFALKVPLTYDGTNAYLNFGEASPGRYLTLGRVRVLSQLNYMPDFHDFVGNYCDGKSYPPRERNFSLDISYYRAMIEHARRNPFKNSNLRRGKR